MTDYPPQGDAMAELLKVINTKDVAGWEARWAKGLEKQILSDKFEPPAEPLLLQLGPKHSAALCGRWLFDHNFKRALPLSQESLDAILDRISSGMRFSHVSRAVRLTAGASVKKHVGKRRRGA